MKIKGQRVVFNVFYSLGGIIIEHLLIKYIEKKLFILIYFTIDVLNSDL